MAKIDRLEIIQGFVDRFRLNPAVDEVMTDTKFIIPTYDFSNIRYSNIVKALDRRTTTAGSVIFTTPSDKDFYLTSAVLCVQADATSDSTEARIAVTNFGDTSTQSILTIGKLALTATSLTQNVNYNPPIRLARNSNILYISAFTVGAQAGTMTISGYTID